MKKYGILSRNRSTYTTKEKTKGFLGTPQPYYWNQGVGRIIAVPLVIEDALFDNTFDNTFN